MKQEKEFSPNQLLSFTYLHFLDTISYHYQLITVAHRVIYYQ